MVVIYLFGCGYCDLCPLCAYGEWVFVARTTTSWHRPYCHLAWTTWSNSTYWSAVDDQLNPLNAELNPICHLLVLLGAHHILHVSRIRVKNRVGTSHNLTLWRHFLASPFARCRLVISFCGVSDTCGRLRLHNLKQRISEISAIPSAMLLRVMGSVLDWVHQCISLDERHMAGVFFKDVTLKECS